MNTNQVMVLVCLLLNLTACVTSIDKPPPDEHEHWHAGVSKIETKKAMLECGYQTPFTDYRSTASNDEISKRQSCMKNSGFTYDDPRGLLCHVFSNLLSCQSNAVIPKRDPQRRFDSQFCKNYAKSDICKP